MTPRLVPFLNNMQNVAIKMLTEKLLTDHLYAVFYYNYPGFIRQDNRLLL